MSNLLSGPIMTYAIPIAVALVILGFIYFRSRKQRNKPVLTSAFEEEKGETPGVDECEVEVVEAKDMVKILARVYSVERRIVGNRELPQSIVKKIIEEHGNLGRQWLREGRRLYALELKDDNYKPVYVAQSMDVTPRDLGNALNQDEVAGWYRPQPASGALSKLGPILLWSGAIIFIIFMMVSD